MARRANGGIYRRGRIWWCHYRVEGERHFESTGTADRREAMTYLARIRRQIRQGNWRPPGRRTVAGYAEEWLTLREQADVRNVHDERTWLDTWLLPAVGSKALDAVTRQDIRRIVVTMQATTSSTTGRAYAPRTVLHVYQTIRLLFADAMSEDLLDATPCTLVQRRGELPKKKDADPRWRAQATYSRAEAEMLIGDERIPADRRVYYALQLLGGMRASEAAGRRWRDLDLQAQPLAHLLVHSQASGHSGDRRTKTEDVKDVPVHPTLARILAAWKEHGFPMLFGHRPRPEDFIVPSRRGPRIARTKTAYKRLKEDLVRLGLRTEGRARHSLRATFLTLAEMDGANMGILSRVTHRTPATGGALGGYLRPGWEAVCAEMAKLGLDLPGAEGVPQNTPDDAGYRDTSGDSRGGRGGPDEKTAAELGAPRPLSHRGDWIRSGSPGRNSSEKRLNEAESPRSAGPEKQGDSGSPMQSVTHVTNTGKDVAEPATPRGKMIADLCESLAGAAADGDLAAARVAHEALGRLLGAEDHRDGAPVVDLASRRDRGSS